MCTPKPFAGATAVNRRIHRAGAAAVDALALAASSETRFPRRRSPAIIRSGSSEACWVKVSTVMVSPEAISTCGFSDAAEKPPMHTRGLDRKMMMGGLGLRRIGLDRFRLRQVRRSAGAGPAAAGASCASASCGQPRWPARTPRPRQRSTSCWRNSRGDSPNRSRNDAAEMRGVAEAVADRRFRRPNDAPSAGLASSAQQRCSRRSRR